MDRRNPPEESPGNSRFLGTIDEILHRYTHCHACGSRLHFSYVTDFSQNIAHESSKCPECHTQVHQLVHKLQ